jgi:hypothetical protein
MQMIVDLLARAQSAVAVGLLVELLGAATWSF